MQPGAFATHLAPALAGTVSFVLMLLLLRSRNLPLDQPNERSLHAIPVPRIGGVAIMLAIIAAALLLQADPAILVPAALLALTSYLDDRRALPAATRLSVHLLAAAAFLFWTGMAMGAMWLVLLLAIGWLTNLYNFMDGADGLAGGMAVIGFFAYGIAAWVQGGTGVALLGFSIAAAAAGFLVFNFPPARIFMGDVGSIPLGFLVGAIGVAGWQRELWPLWFPIVVFAPFVADASLTLLRRLLRGERVWQAHRQHYYQRLILSGWSHRRTALAEFVLMVLCAAVALACRDQALATQVLALAALTVALVLAMWSVDRRWARHTADANA